MRVSNKLNRHSSLRNIHISEDIQKTIAAHEANLKQAITELNESRSRLGSELEEVSAHPPPEADDEDAEDLPRAVEEIHQQGSALGTSQNALERALAKTENRTGVRVTNITVDETGKVLAGLINTQGKYSQVDVTVDNVKATKGGKVIAGIVEGVTIDF